MNHVCFDVIGYLQAVIHNRSLVFNLVWLYLIWIDFNLFNDDWSFSSYFYKYFRLMQHITRAIASDGLDRSRPLIYAWTFFRTHIFVFKLWDFVFRTRRIVAAHELVLIRVDLHGEFEVASDVRSRNNIYAATETLAYSLADGETYSIIAWIQVRTLTSSYMYNCIECKVCLILSHSNSLV